MALWVVRGSRDGSGEALALESGLVTVDWPSVGDLRGFESREDLEAFYWQIEPYARPNRITAQVSQLWSFGHRMEPGDLVAMPLRRRPEIAFGEIRGPYRYRKTLPPYARHTRPVQWLDPGIPRAAFDQDLRWSLGALLTVFAVKRNHAEERIRAMLP